MKILFATGRMLWPFFRGGDGTTVNQLLCGFRQLGDDCLAVGKLIPTTQTYTIDKVEEILNEKKIAFTNNKNYLKYETNFTNYLIKNSKFEKSLSTIIQQYNPNVIITQLEDSDKVIGVSKNMGIPVVLYVHDNSEENLLSLKEKGLRFIFYNSNFIAQKFTKFSFIPSEIVFPVFDSDLYYSEKTNPTYVTMINPTERKGGKIFYEVCKKLTTISFQVVKGWTGETFNTEAFSNVKQVEFGADMKNVYTESKFILVPSQWDEAFCRIPIEAGFSKIPTIASKVGGLPESVGNSGILISDYANPLAWIAAIKKLNNDTELINILGRKAFENSQKFTIEKNVSEIRRVLYSLF